MLADGLAAQLGDLLGDGFEQRAGLVVQGIGQGEGRGERQQQAAKREQLRGLHLFSPYQALQPVL
ncbi:hypothetical protein P4095_00610 [Pseudomonas aeruginosa]|uniref:hypothetical protein n=1 Tax=Pseudomonas aeruginosa TaxID=287 RepID=UPI00249A0973|nr:hypothetical protein [Pseudomonas aeruginosa]MDF5885080.1 hypothetical protein [Pseudomonas aeruginosa]WGW53650.1 hypothetical protein P7I87_29885 [Pseudomonas aeruginosa]